MHTDGLYALACLLLCDASLLRLLNITVNQHKPECKSRATGISGKYKQALKEKNQKHHVRLTTPSNSKRFFLPLLAGIMGVAVTGCLDQHNHWSEDVVHNAA